MRYRITLRRVDHRLHGPDTVELRGYMDDFDNVSALATALYPMGIRVIASVATDDYDPFLADGAPPRRNLNQLGVQQTTDGVVTVEETPEPQDWAGSGRLVECRRCHKPILPGSWRFGSDEAGWEHMQGECP